MNTSNGIGSPTPERKEEQDGMAALFTLIRLILIPVGILNFTGGIVGGIWLAVLGKWDILGFGIGAIIIANFGLVTVACIPGMLFGAPAATALEKGKYVFATACSLLSHLWTFVVMTAWCVGIFYVVLAGYTGGSIWPFLLWAYNTATGQWTYMAWVENQASGGQSITSTLAAIGACVGAIALMGVFLFNPDPPIFDSVRAFCIPILVVLAADIMPAEQGRSEFAQTANPVLCSKLTLNDMAASPAA